MSSIKFYKAFNCFTYLTLATVIRYSNRNEK